MVKLTFSHSFPYFSTFFVSEPSPKNPSAARPGAAERPPEAPPRLAGAGRERGRAAETPRRSCRGRGGKRSGVGLGLGWDWGRLRVVGGRKIGKFL